MIIIDSDASFNKAPMHLHWKKAKIKKRPNKNKKED
jgi:hypothetical protein